MEKMAKVPTKRICELEVGDRFILSGIEREVYNITADALHFHTPAVNNLNLQTYSAKSQWRVEVC